MYCSLFKKYISNIECDHCDVQAQFEVGSWRDMCSRFEHHPLFYSIKWWLKPKALYFKLLICIRWVTRRFPLKRRFMIWSNRDGMHLGFWRPDLSWIEPIEEERRLDD